MYDLAAFVLQIDEFSRILQNMVERLEVQDLLR